MFRAFHERLFRGFHVSTFLLARREAPGEAGTSWNKPEMRRNGNTCVLDILFERFSGNES
jgi:hypothetical protein